MCIHPTHPLGRPLYFFLKLKMPFRVIVSKRILNRQLIRHFSTQQGQTKIEKIQTDLKQQLDLYINKFNQASDKLKQLTSDVSNSQEALQKASRALNELTGYNHIETVKHKVTRQCKSFGNNAEFLSNHHP